MAGKGLAYEIGEIDKIIVGKRKRGKTAGFEEELLKSYLRVLKQENPLEYSSLVPQLKSIKVSKGLNR